MSHLVVLLALLWYALVPAFVRTSPTEGPSVRVHRSAIVHAIAGARTTTRETTREEAPSPFEPIEPQPIIAPAAFVRGAAPASANLPEPHFEPFTAVARGPPSR